MRKFILYYVVLVLVLALMSGTAQALVLSYTPGGEPSGAVYFFGDSDPCNVNGGNDAATYLAHDRPGIGQTFMTGMENLNMAGFSLKNVFYDFVTGNGTWWYLDYDGGTSLQVRVTDPAQAGTPGFVVHSEDYVVTGTEEGIELMPENWDADKVGTGTWAHFQFDGLVSLLPEKEYGFDVTVTGGGMYFFELAGYNEDLYPGGTAYQTGVANGTNSLEMDVVWDGDHQFAVQLVPEPATMVLLGLGSLALLRRKRS